MSSAPDPHRNSLHRFLRNSQTTTSTPTLRSLTALLLSQSSWRILSLSPEYPVPPTISPHDCYPFLFHDSDLSVLELLHHPSAATVSSLPNIGLAHDIDYRPSDACVAVSLSWQASPAILFSPLLASPTRLWAAGGLDGRRVRSVSLAPSSSVLAATVGPDIVIYRASPADAFMHENRRLPDPDKAQVALATYADDNLVFSGTSTGQLRCWDLRAPGPPVSSLDPTGKRLYIGGIRVGQVSGDVYVSCELAQENYLAAWDVRMMRPRQGPKRAFLRDRWGDSIAFDLVEQAGLVVGGGSDNAVSMWDCWEGGNALRKLQIDEEIKCVKVMGLSGEGSGERPGLFVKGEYETFVFEVGARDGSAEAACL